MNIPLSKDTDSAPLRYHDKCDKYDYLIAASCGVISVQDYPFRVQRTVFAGDTGQASYCGGAGYKRRQGACRSGGLRQGNNDVSALAGELGKGHSA